MEKTSAPRIAVIGCGAMSELYYLPALAADPAVKANLTLVDTNGPRRQALADKFQIANGVTNYRELLGQVDGAILAVPHQFHYPMAMELLADGVHVLCEKPLAETAQEAQQMVAQAARAGVTISVNHQRRLFPAYIKVKELIDTGALGTLLSLQFIDGEAFRWPTVSGFYFQKDSPHGVLLDRGVHGLDAICWWLGSKPRLISCEDDSFGGVEGTSLIRCEHNGCPIEVRLSWLTKLKNTYTLVGERATVEGQVSEWDKLELRYATGRHETLKLNSHVTDSKAFGTQIVANFVDVIRHQAQPLIPAAGEIPALELIEECYAQATPLRMPWYAAVQPLGADHRSVFVTGAGGFIGGWVVEGLKLRGFTNVRAGLRRWSSAARIARFPTERVTCDVLDREQVAQAMAGAEAVVHCAVGAHAVIVQGTQNLLDAALQAGVRRFVYLSTAEVYGNASGNIDETYPYATGGNDYAQAKIEAEQLCWRYSEAGLPVTILRPAIVYGPFGQAWTVRYAERLQSDNWGIFEGHGDGRCNLIYVDDLVTAIVQALTRDTAVGQAFNINGPDQVTWNEYFERFNAALGLPPLRRISASRSRIKAAVLEPARSASAYLLKRFGPAAMKLYTHVDVAHHLMASAKNSLKTNPNSIELLTLYNRHAHYVSTKAQHLLGFEPEHDLAAGLRLSVAWLEQQGLAPQPVLEH